MNSVHNIAFFTYVLARGGAEKVLSNMTLNFPPCYNINIFLYDCIRIDYPYRGTLFDLKLKTPPYDSLLQEIYTILKCTKQIRKLKKDLGINLCISLLETPNLINVLSGISKSVISVQNHKSTGFRFKGIMAVLAKWLVKTLYNRADLVVAASKGVANDLIKNFGVHSEKIRVIYNPCNAKNIEEKAGEEIEGEHKPIFDNPVVINVGRITRQKGQWHLIRAFSKVKEKCKEAKLVIIGEGEEENYLKILTNKLNLTGDVYFLGFQKNPFKYLAKSKVFVLSSLWEGFANVVPEAMACKTPVISTDCRSGPREIFAPDTDIESQTKDIEYAKHGILVPVPDGAYKKANDPLTREEKILADAILELLTDDDLRKKYSSIGYERVLNFSIEKFIGEWSNLIKKI